MLIGEVAIANIEAVKPSPPTPEFQSIVMLIILKIIFSMQMGWGRDIIEEECLQEIASGI